jgi:hypothetical protein
MKSILAQARQWMMMNKVERAGGHFIIITLLGSFLKKEHPLT